MSMTEVVATLVPASAFVALSIGAQTPTLQKVLSRMNSLVNASNAQIARLIAAVVLITVFVGAVVVAGIDLVNNQPIPMMVLTTLNIAIGFGLHALGVATGTDAAKQGASLIDQSSGSGTSTLASQHTQSANPGGK